MTRPTPKPTSCCGFTAYQEALYLMGAAKIRFAVAARCSKCHRVIGDYKLDWTESKDLKAIQNKFNGTSWAMMIEVLRKRPSAPLNFEEGSVGLVPLGYEGEKRHEAELAAEVVEDEPPF